MKLRSLLVSHLTGNHTRQTVRYCPAVPKTSEIYGLVRWQDRSPLLMALSMISVKRHRIPPRHQICRALVPVTHEVRSIARRYSVTQARGQTQGKMSLPGPRSIHNRHHPDGTSVRILLGAKGIIEAMEFDEIWGNSEAKKFLRQLLSVTSFSSVQQRAFLGR